MMFEHKRKGMHPEEMARVRCLRGEGASGDMEMRWYFERLRKRVWRYRNSKSSEASHCIGALGNGVKLFGGRTRIGKRYI